MALPTFFIIGAAKSGTTSLYHYLAQHPQIQMSARKEPNFYSGPDNGIPFRWGRVESLQEYEALFDPAVEVRGEASTAYTTFPRRQGVPERIRDAIPDAKFIYLVRDPIARTLSQYQHRVALEGERRSLRAVLGDLSDPSSDCIAPSLYASQLERYLRHFPAGRFLVVDQADLLADRSAALREIFDFLCVEDLSEALRLEDELNTTRERPVYPAAYARLVYVHLRGAQPRAAVRWIPGPARRAIRGAFERAMLPRVQKPVLDTDLRVRLERLFEGEAARLRAITAKSFASWSV